MKKRDPDLTRNYLQKAVCVLSELPLFGSIMSKLEPTTRAFFNQADFKDNEVFIFFIYKKIYELKNGITPDTKEHL
jgi:hypothetical protein